MNYEFPNKSNIEYPLPPPSATHSINHYNQALPPLTPVVNQNQNQNQKYAPAPRELPIQYTAAANVPHDPSTQVAVHLLAISDLIKPIVAQNHELIGLRKEVDLWKSEWSRSEADRKHLDAELRSIKSKPNFQPPRPSGPTFSAVLIDGNGHIFQDEFLQAGFAGGQRAAQALLSALPSIGDHIDPSMSPVSAELVLDTNGTVLSGSPHRLPPAPRALGSTVVQIFLNKSGLGTTLTKIGTLPSWGVYESFWQGFSASHELFTVVDVGPGKEATDIKIREHLRLYTRNAQCELVLLGTAHDNGYANVLSSLKAESRLSKLLLLKGYHDLAQGLKPYSSVVISIPGLFRTTRLPSIPASFASAVGQPTPSSPAKKKNNSINNNNSSNSNSSGNNNNSNNNSNNNNSNNNSNHKPDPIEVPLPPASSLGSSDGDSFEWADLDKAKLSPKDEDWKEAGKKKTKKDKKEEKTKGKSGSVNIGGTVRNLKPRPCHAHYLGPRGCKTGDRCQYGHNYKLNKGQMEELTILTKQMLCPYIVEGKCHFSDDECVYGHKCPRGRHCPFNEDCRFAVLPDAHDIDDDDQDQDQALSDTDQALAKLDI
ncbi:hypothetical protein BCR39DRAFT_545280 [Naematelia encephala]|uniref:C3H1-type domain-containing protein n=1 Tax=Naematelia encephala TaxID=71784 RepID=A0A1Y2ARB5_9TREE|nr:hypothetical protein BCR39DRAFT_545280 [Naematelia encephala]